MEHGTWTEAEHTTVGGDQPVAVASRCAGHSDDGLVEGRRSGRTVEGSVVAEHAPVGGDQLIPGTDCLICPRVGRERGLVDDGAAKEDDLVRRRVKVHRGRTSSWWANAGRLLGPCRPVVGPGVVEDDILRFRLAAE